MKIDLQFFGGRGSGSGMTSSSTSGGSSFDDGFDPIDTAGANAAIDDYWNTGWGASRGGSGKSYIAEILAGGEDAYAKAYADRGRGSEAEGREDYQDTVYMATLDVAKRMGYDIEPYAGDKYATREDIEDVMGTRNTDMLVSRVISSAQGALDSHKSRRRRR